MDWSRCNKEELNEPLPKDEHVDPRMKMLTGHEGEQRFYLVKTRVLGDKSILQYILDNGQRMMKQREELLDLLDSREILTILSLSKKITVKDIETFLDKQATVTREHKDYRDHNAEEPDEFSIEMRQGREEEENGILLVYSKIISKQESECFPLKELVDRLPDGKKILTHPVVEAFLMMKWYKIQKFWWLWILAKIAFMISFTLFGFEVLSENRQHWKNSTYFNCKMDIETKIETPAFAWITAIIWTLFLLVELCQIAMTISRFGRRYGGWDLIWMNIRQYITVRNVLQILILILCGHLLLAGRKCGSVLLSFAYPLIYLEFLYELGYHPGLYKYIHMFRRVVKSYSEITCLYGGFVLAFGLGFYQMFPYDEEFPREGSI